MSHTRETQRLHTDTILSTSEPEENRRDAWRPSNRCSPTRRKPVCRVLSRSPGTVAAWEQPQRHEGSGRPFPQGGRGALLGALWGGGRAARGPLRCLLLWTPGPALSGERTHVVNRDYRGPWGRLGRLDMSVHPCGPHLRASGKHREGVTSRTPAP